MFNTALIYSFVVDGAESELGILDLIQVCRVTLISVDADSQVFVESLDRAFENVCELDLIFHFDEVSITRRHTNIELMRRSTTS